MHRQTIKIEAADGARSDALLAALGGFDGETVSQNGTHEVHVRLDSHTASSLTLLFHAIGTWLTDGGEGACKIHFGDRSLLVAAPTDGRAGDASQFLLERTIQLQIALDSRVVIEQAKGMLAERLRNRSGRCLRPPSQRLSRGRRGTDRLGGPGSRVAGYASVDRKSRG
jgi:hypothetical protein